MRFSRPPCLALTVTAVALALVGSAASGCSGCKESKERRRVETGSGAEAEPAGGSAAVVKPVVPTGPHGTVTGKVMFTGQAPEMPFINNGTDPVCAAKKMRAETILVNDNATLRNAIIRVKPGSIAPLTPSEPVVVNQLDCMYRPRVQGAVAGQPLIIYNGDETAHNVHVRAAEIGDRQGAEALWNRQQPKKSTGLPPIKSLVEDHPVMRLKCDQHGWMSGYLLVSDNPYSVVTGEDGSFSLDVPAGEIVIEAWHEFYGLKEVVVTVTEGQPAAVEFSFDATADNPTAAKPAPAPAPAKGT